MTGPYTRGWAGYKKFLFLHFVVLGLIPIYFFGNQPEILGPLVKLMPDAAMSVMIWVTLYIYIVYRIRNWPCPRCRRYFFTPIHISPNITTVFLTHECRHCGLPKYADDDVDKK